MYHCREATYEEELRHIFPEMDADERHDFAARIELAIRVAALVDGAPARCRRRTCRVHGECRQRGLRLDQPACCGMLPDHAGDSVKAMLLFAGMLEEADAAEFALMDAGEREMPDVADLLADPHVLLPLEPFRVAW